jgi:hypothetical protein
MSGATRVLQDRQELLCKGELVMMNTRFGKDGLRGISVQLLLCALLVFFVFSGLSYGAGASLRKGPYLMFAATGAKTVDNTGMTVLWQTDSTPASATIEWGISQGSYGAPVTVTENGSGQDEHQFSYTITGLNTGTMYSYRITVDGASANGSFKTPPNSASTSLTFYGYGDIRGNQLFSDTEFTQHSLVEERIMSDVRQNVSTQQTVLINASDFVNCGMDEHYWDRQYFNRTLTGSLDFMANLPLIAPVGNHERYWAGIKDDSGNCNLSLYPYTGMTADNACHVIEPTNHGELFNKYFPYSFYPVPKGPGAYKDYYYLNDYGTARFLMLDTFFSPFTSGSPQYTWLAGNIRSSTRWNIPVFHAPMWAARYPIDPAKAVELRDALGPVFESNYVPLVIQGHDHFYSRLLVNGITYLTLGGGGAALSDIIPQDPASAPYTVKSAKLYHYARFEISGNTMIVTVIDVPGNTVIDTFKILPPTTNISPANDQTTSSCTPTLHASPFVSQDGATHQASQWIVRDTSDNKIVHVTSCIDASTHNSYSCFDTRNLTSYTPPPLKCGQHYQWQVVYKDSNGNTTQASTLAPFQTPAHTGDTNAYGIPVTANQVNDKSGAPIGVINGGNVTALRTDATFRASVPQIDAVATIIYAGSVTDLSGNIIPVHPAGFSLAKTQGGTGQPFAIVAGGTGTVGNIMPISNAGYTVSDNSGNMKRAATFVTPSGGYLPYGIFDFIVNVTAGSTAKIVIVPPEPFTQGTKWYRLDATAGPLKEYPYFEVNSQGNGILTITDNGAGDSDQRLGIIRDTGGPVGSGGSSSGCFIATAAFGSYLHPYVEVLTSFRDSFLNTNAAGRSFVAWYYRISPPVANAIQTNETAKAVVRILLIPAVGFGLLCLKIGFVPTLLILLLCGVTIVIGIRKRFFFGYTSRV